ncbi:cysteine hydrolase family protein [Egicoccus sp. AB-alg2]|uniref:cysteine hydrolase family protein n=1 Tax=Egicoccus sp. AB-alg2 TaxID=3242693 RepID=UPI00359DA602
MEQDVGGLGSDVPPTLSADRVVLLLVDLQNDFLHPDGASGRLGRLAPDIRDVLAPLKDFVGVRRDQGIPVVYTRRFMRPGEATTSTAALAEQRHTYCLPGSWGADIVDDLPPEPGDLVVDKPGASAFLRTSLTKHLRNLGRSHVLVAGVTLEVCVESTVRDAQDLGFSPVLLRDLTWPNRGAQAEATHARLERHFCAVVEAVDVDRQLAGQATPATSQ